MSRHFASSSMIARIVWSMFPPLGYMSPEPCAFTPNAGTMGRSLRLGIRNDRPIVPAFGVNAQGSGDMYPKGGNMLHTIRAIIDDDAKWRDILRGLSKTFYHQTVTGKQVEDYISRE